MKTRNSRASRASGHDRICATALLLGGSSEFNHLRWHPHPDGLEGLVGVSLDFGAGNGYYGIQTNEKDLDVQKILDAYHTLWKIEESFRIMKSTLEVRPVFHWTEPRIKGHFVVCFLAFLLGRTLEYKLKSIKEASPQKIREALNAMSFTEVEIENKMFCIKTKGTELGNKILRALRVRPPKNIIPADDLSL